MMPMAFIESRVNRIYLMRIIVVKKSKSRKVEKSDYKDRKIYQMRIAKQPINQIPNQQISKSTNQLTDFSFFVFHF